jgi:uncharacterized protein (TIGR02453 family)
VSFTGFRPAAFAFLRGLARNNRKEWFEARRATYEDELRAPMRALIDDLDVILGDVAPELRGDRKKSMFRIHRDVRFSKDKSPYKTNAACWLFHQDAGHGVGSDAHGGAGFYFHLQPASCFVGGGVWMPPKPALDRVRDDIAGDLRGFERIVTERSFVARYGDLDDEAMLHRVPRGYASDHPAAKWLRYRSFIVGRKVADRTAGSRRLLTELRTDIEVMLPFVRRLNSALGLRPRSAR